MGMLKFRAPPLPVPRPEYSQDQFSQFMRALSIYFSQIDDAYWAGYRIVNPYGAVQDNTDQYAAAINTPTQVVFNVTDYVNQMRHLGTDGLTVTYPGIYNYQFSIQFANTDTQINEAIVWLKKKASGAVSSTNIVGTGSRFSVPNRHGGVDGYLIAAVNFYIELNAGDTVELWWEGSAVANLSGTVKGIYLEHYDATATVPSIPSAVATLSFVSAIP